MLKILPLSFFNDVHGLLEPESQLRLGRQNNLVIARKRAATRTRSATG